MFKVTYFVGSNPCIYFWKLWKMSRNKYQSQADTHTAETGAVSFSSQEMFFFSAILSHIMPK